MARFDGWVTELADPVKMKEINDQQSNGRCCSFLKNIASPMEC